MTQDEEIREHLTSSNPEFRSLAEQHHSLEDRLRELNTDTHLSEDQQLQEVNLKKQKLNVKDHMNQMIQNYRHEHAEPQPS
jgi:uncharacterized protein YdcH (DUF465 family)